MARLSRRERELQAEIDWQAKHYKSELDEPDDETGILGAENNQNGISQPASDLTTEGEQVATNAKKQLTVPASEQDIERFDKPYLPDVQKMRDYTAELRAMAPSLLKAKVAKEYDLEAKQFIDQIANSHESAITKFLFRMHKLAVSAMNRIAQPALELRAECQRIQIDWNREVKRKADEEQRKREAAAKAEQERQRAEEVAHLKAQEKIEEAKELEAAPLPPPSLPAPLKPAGKVEGVTLIEVLKIDPDDPFTDAVEFWTKFFPDHPECWSMVELKPGDWKRYLTSNKGTITPGGLKIVAATETRTRE